MKDKKIVVATADNVKLNGRTSELVFVVRSILESIGKSHGLEFSMKITKDQMVFELSHSNKKAQCNIEAKDNDNKSS